MYKIIAPILSLSILLTSCCSLFRDSTEDVFVTTEPSSANVVIDGYNCGTSPLVVELDRKCDHIITASTPGYETSSTKIRSKRTWQASWNAASPFTGAALGAATLLAICGTDAYGLPILCGALFGGVIGVGAAVAGAAIDLYKQADRTLSAKEVHLELVEGAN